MSLRQHCWSAPLNLSWMSCTRVGKAPAQDWGGRAMLPKGFWTIARGFSVPPVLLEMLASPLVAAACTLDKSLQVSGQKDMAEMQKLDFRRSCMHSSSDVGLWLVFNL